MLEKGFACENLKLLTPVKDSQGVPRASSPKEIVIKIPSERRFRHRYDIEVDEDRIRSNHLAANRVAESGLTRIET